MTKCDICERFIWRKLVKHSFKFEKYYSGNKVGFHFHEKCWMNFKWIINNSHDIKEIDNNYSLVESLLETDTTKLNDRNIL